MICLTGAAMVPTLGSAPKGDSGTGSAAAINLLLRCIPRPSMRSVFVGDVVAFTAPELSHSAKPVLVRRIAAVEGEEMVSDDPADEAFTLPEGLPRLKCV